MTARVRNRRGEGDRLRAELVHAAAALVEGGGEELSLRAVARRAGVAPQSLYLQFADKQSLLDAVCEARFADLTAVLSAVGAGEPRARLRAMCLAYCRFAAERPRQYRILFADPGGHPAGVAQPRQQALAVFDDAVRACTGETAALSATTLGVWAALHGTVLLRQDQPGLPWPPLEQALDTLLTATLR